MVIGLDRWCLPSHSKITYISLIQTSNGGLERGAQSWFYPIRYKVGSLSLARKSSPQDRTSTCTNLIVLWSFLFTLACPRSFYPRKPMDGSISIADTLESMSRSTPFGAESGGRTSLIKSTSVFALKPGLIPDVSLITLPMRALVSFSLTAWAMRGIKLQSLSSVEGAGVEAPSPSDLVVPIDADVACLIGFPISSTNFWIPPVASNWKLNECQVHNAYRNAVINVINKELHGQHRCEVILIVME